MEVGKIKDSGARREFESGAVRDIQEGKGRCDLMPLDVLAGFYGDHCTDEDHEEIAEIFENIHLFQEDGEIHHLENAIMGFTGLHYEDRISKMLLEAAIHFEEGAKKYGDNNWQKGIPVRCYIDSAVRHFLKFLREDMDEPHDRAFCWNIMCAIWTCLHKPELNDYTKNEMGE